MSVLVGLPATRAAEGARRKPKILLLRANACRSRGAFTRQEAVCPPMGLLYLAAVLRERYPEAYDLRILDPGVRSLGRGEVARLIGEEQPDLVGLSALATEMECCDALIRDTREQAPAARLVVGGPCVQTLSARLAVEPGVDCAVLGEGEETFAELVPRLLAGESLLGVPGLFTRDSGGQVVFTGARPLIDDLDAMPFPAWDLVDLPSYSNVRNMNYGLQAASPYASLFTSRGCPWPCTYCHSNFGKKVRWRSPENVLREMTLLVERHGVREFHFYDDIFNLDGPRSGVIMDLIAERGWALKLAFPNGLRGDILTEDLLRRYRRAGTYLICFAVETATPRLQKMIRKNVDLEKTRRIIQQARAEGIIPLGFFMLGFPTETVEEIRATIDWACDSALLKAFFFSVIPFEGTAIADQAREAAPGVSVAPTVTFHSEDCYYTAATGVDLTRLQQTAYLRFYLNPVRLLTFFGRYPRKRYFFLNLAGGVKDLFLTSWRELRA